MLKAALIAVVVAMPVFAQTDGKADDGGWKPAGSPIESRFAKDVKVDSVLPEYPRPSLVRTEWQSLNGLWEWEAIPGGAAEAEDWRPAEGKPLAKKILVPFAPESSLSGVGEHAAHMWYRRTIRVPQGWRDRNIIVQFGGVDWRANVFVNGQQVAAHEGGYAPFGVDITEALRPGEEQVLEVEVRDQTDKGPQPRGKQVEKPGGIFYTPTSGIWQTVWMEPVPAPSISRPMVTAELNGRVTVEWTNGQVAPGLAVEVVALDGEAEVGRADLRPTADEPIPAVIVFTLEKPRLWTPQTPHLYTLRLTLKESATEKPLDEAETYFGVRTVRVENDKEGTPRLMLNGEPVFCLGLLDQGFWPEGIYTAPTDEALRSDIEVTKRLGFNTIRKHVKVEPERWYYWADKLGVLVWQDMPSGDRSIRPEDPDITRTADSQRVYEGELWAMLMHLRTHPSIVMWVPFNEGWGQFDTARITDGVRQIDPTRPVNSASGWSDRGTGQVSDIHAYPGPEAPKPDGKRVLMLGEFGGLGLGVKGHTWSKESWGYKGMKDKGELTEQYVALLKKVRELKETAGLSGAIYTQTTDVETECNGVMTYDRAEVKMDEKKVREANEGVLKGAWGGGKKEEKKEEEKK